MKRETINDLCRLSEEGARKLLEDIRWPDGPVCHHCGSTDSVAKMQSALVRDAKLSVKLVGGDALLTRTDSSEGVHPMA